MFPEDGQKQKEHERASASKTGQREHLFNLELGRLSAVSRELVFNQTNLKRRYQQQNNDHDARSLANNDSNFDSEEENQSINSEEKDERRFQKEVDKIIQKIVTLDLGDAVSNHDMKSKMNQYKEDNKYLTA